MDSFEKVWDSMSQDELVNEELNLVGSVNFAQDQLENKYMEFVAHWKNKGLKSANDQYQNKLIALASARDVNKTNLRQFKTLCLVQLQIAN